MHIENFCLSHYFNTCGKYDKKKPQWQENATPQNTATEGYCFSEATITRKIMYVLQQSWAMGDITAKSSTHARHCSTLTRARFRPLCFRFKLSVVWIPRNLFRRPYSSWAPYVTIPKTSWRSQRTPVAVFKSIRPKMELNPNLKRGWLVFPWGTLIKHKFCFLEATLFITRN